eukprot:7184292-Alexandrium_andersonii.AAC.1
MVDKGGRARNALRRGARREERVVHRDTHQATVACQLESCGPPEPRPSETVQSWGSGSYAHMCKHVHVCANPRRRTAR